MTSHASVGQGKGQLWSSLMTGLFCYGFTSVMRMGVVCMVGRSKGEVQSGLLGARVRRTAVASEARADDSTVAYP